MVQKIIGQYDVNTGEVIEGGHLVYVPPKRQNGFMQGWFAMALLAVDELQKIKRVEDYRVFFSLLKRLDYENFINASQAEIARDLKMHRSHVNAAIKRLIGMGFIIEGPKVGINRTYRLNPNVGWRGTAQNHVKALDEYRSKRMKKANISTVLEGGSEQQEPLVDPRQQSLFEFE